MVRLDRSWFGESPAAIYNFDNCPYNILFTWEVLSCWASKAVFFLPKAIENRRVQIICSLWIRDFSDLLRTHQGQSRDFLKSTRYVSDKQFSFEKPAALPQPPLKTGQGHSCQFWKPTGTILPVLKTFLQFKSFWLQTANNFLIQYIIKELKTLLRKLWSAKAYQTMLL